MYNDKYNRFAAYVYLNLFLM